MQINGVKFDVAAIGGGMAGYAAALSAADNGKKTVLITKGPGATAMSGGVIDICSNPNVGPRITWEKLTDVGTNVAETIIRLPRHPYGVAAGNSAEAVMDLIEESVAFIRSKLLDAGLIFDGDVFEQTPVPTALGVWKLTSLTQACQQRGAPPAGSAVLGIKNLNFPNAGFLANMLEATIEAKGMGAGEMVDSLEIEFEPERMWSVAELYERLSRRGAWNKFIEIVKKAGGEKFGLLLIPPVIPYDAASSELTLPGGTALKEIVGQPTNAGGLRLCRALEKAVVAANVTIVKGEALKFETGGSELKKLSVSSEGAALSIEADKWILATGKFIGGGLKKDDEFKESLLVLPVFCDGEPVKKIWTKKLLGDSIIARHKLFEVGLLTDGALRPVDADGVVVYKNLHAAGSALGGYNYHSDGCGFGVCITTGVMAGKEASV